MCNSIFLRGHVRPDDFLIKLHVCAVKSSEACNTLITVAALADLETF